MRNLWVIIFVSVFILGSTSLFAGAGHEHKHDGSHAHGSISSEKAETKATKRVKRLADAGKIDKSWAQVKASSVAQKTYAKGPEWVVTFKNTNVSDVNKQSLYLFYSLDGHYIAANYTGN